MDKNVDLINKRIIFFIINQAVKEENILPKKTDEITPNMLEEKADQIYSAVMGFWKCAMNNCTKADYVAALYKGVVVGVFPVNHKSWFYVSGVDPDKIPVFINQKRRDVDDVKKIQAGKKPSNKKLKGKKVCFFKTNEAINNDVGALLGNTVYSEKLPLKSHGTSVLYSWDRKK